jgi:hypothetical protein
MDEICGRGVSKVLVSEKKGLKDPAIQSPMRGKMIWNFAV